MGEPKLSAIGRYELLLELGRGGMAVLYLARAQGVGGFSKLFAIKQILPHLAADPPFVEMFLNEGRIAARLSHPNLCPVFELGQDRGELYLVMEYLDGVPWDDLSAAAPRDIRGLALTAAVLAQACEGLHHAHTFRDVDGTATPIVHRDVSPQNLFVSADGVCRVLDFGVSKITSDRRRTRTGILKGKLPYMAPEQLRGELADPRADIWAVGVMLWEALAGERLFDRDTDFLTYQAIVDAPIPPLSARGSRYPATIDQVIARALGRDRETRYATARDLGRDLLQVARQVGGAATREQIAEAVTALCGDQLTARRRAIAAALASRSAPDPDATANLRGPSADAAPDAAATVPGEAAETISMMMRREAIVVQRSRRKRWRSAALGLTALAALAGGIVAVRALRSGPEVAAAPATAPPAATAPSAAAPTASADDQSIAGSPAAANASAPGAGTLGDQPASTDDAARNRTPTAIRDPAVATTSPTHRRGAAAPAKTSRKSATSSSPHAPSSSGASPGTRETAGRATDAADLAKSNPYATGSEPSPGAREPVAPASPDPAIGWYAVDSNPYATIFIDDRKIGDTPLDRIALPAGRHRVRAILPDGRARTFAIDIAPDRKTTSGTLTW